MSAKLTDAEWADIQRKVDEAEDEPDARFDDPAWRRFWEPPTRIVGPNDPEAAHIRPDLPEGQEPAADFQPRVPSHA